MDLKGKSTHAHETLRHKAWKNRLTLATCSAAGHIGKNSMFRVWYNPCLQASSRGLEKYPPWIRETNLTGNGKERAIWNKVFLTGLHWLFHANKKLPY